LLTCSAVWVSLSPGSDFEDEDLDSDDEEILGTEAASKIKRRKEAGSDEDMDELDEMLLAGSGSDGESGAEGEEGEEEEDLDDISGDEQDLNDETHSALLSKMAKMSGTRRREQMTEGAEGEFALTNDQEAEVSLGDLMGSFTDNPGESGLKKKLSKLEKKAPKAAPLGKAAKERLDRAAAYDKSSKDVTKWQGQVQKERQAEQLILAEEATPRIVSSASLAANHTAKTVLETQVQAALAAAGMDEASIAKYEELELKKCSVEEVQARQKELAKMRSLMLNSELKAKRQKKIKSKKFHKIAKKDSEKKEQASLDLLKLSDPAAYRERMLQLERKQAEERMTQKHKNTGKWVSRQLQRGVGNANTATRQAITHQLQLGEALKKKQMSTGDDSDSGEGSGDEGGDEFGGADSLWESQAQKETEQEKGIHALKFMQRGRDKQKEEAEKLLQEMQGDPDQEEAETAKQGAGRKSYASTAATGKRKAAPTKEEEEALRAKLPTPDTGLQIGPDSVSTRTANRLAVGKASEAFEVANWQIDADDAPGAGKGKGSSTGKLNRKATGGYGKDPAEEEAASAADEGERAGGKRARRSPRLAANPAPEPKAGPNPWLERVSDRSRQAAGASGGAELEVDKVMQAAGKRFAITDEAQEALVRQAFAGEDTAQVFVQEKAALVKEGVPDLPDDGGGMAGWGSWTGSGAENVAKEEAREAARGVKRKRQLAEETSKRKDAKLDKVVINEKRDKKGAKYMAKNLPQGFANAAQYDRAIRQPMGKEWVSDRTHVQMMKKEVVTRKGQVIQPAKLNGGANASNSRAKYKG